MGKAQGGEMNTESVLVALLILFVVGLWAWLFIQRRKVWVKIVDVKNNISKNRDKLDYVWCLFRESRRIGYPEILYEAFYGGRDVYLPGSYCPPNSEDNAERYLKTIRDKLKKVLTGKIVRIITLIFLPIWPVNFKSQLKKLEDLSASLDRTISQVKNLYWSSLYLTHNQEMSRGYRINYGLHRQISNRIEYKRKVLDIDLRLCSAGIDHVVERQQQEASDLKKVGLDPAFYTNGSKKWRKRLDEIREVQNKSDFSNSITEFFLLIYEKSEKKQSGLISENDLLGKVVEKIRDIKSLYTQVQSVLKFQATCELRGLDTIGVLTTPGSVKNLNEKIKVDKTLLKWAKEYQLQANLDNLNNLKLSKLEKELILSLKKDSKSFKEEQIESRLKAEHLMLEWRELDDKEFLGTLLDELFDPKTLKIMDSEVLIALQKIVGFSDIVRENIERIRFLTDESWEILALLVEEDIVHEADVKTHPFLHFVGHKEFKFNSNDDDPVIVTTRIEAAALQIRELAHILNSQQMRLKKLQSLLGARKEVLPEFEEVKEILLHETTKFWVDLDPAGLDSSLEHVRAKLEAIVEKSQTLEAWARTILFFRHKLDWLEEEEKRASEVYKISLENSEEWYKNQKISISVMVKHWANFDELQAQNLESFQLRSIDGFQIQLQKDEASIRERIDFRQEKLATRLLERLQEVRFQPDVTEKTRTKILDFHNIVQNGPEVVEKTIFDHLGFGGTVRGVPKKIEFGLIEEDPLLTQFEDSAEKARHSKMSLGERVEYYQATYGPKAGYQQDEDSESGTRKGFDIREVFAKGK